MKNLRCLTCIFLAFFITACQEMTHPLIETFYIKGGSIEQQKVTAVFKLYEMYRDGNKDKNAYEVIAKKEGRFIINYTPKSELLTLSADPGSGWSNQFKNVTEQTLQRLAVGGYSFDSLGAIALDPVKYDSLLVPNDSPFVRVMTSGNP